MSNTTTNEPTTEIALRDGSGTVTVSETFAARFPALAPTEEMLEVFEENLGGETLNVTDFRKIKVPSDELNSWVVTKGGEEVSTKELVGVMIAIKPRRSYWQSDNPDGSFPDCWSADAKMPSEGGLYHPSGELGHMNPKGLCATCPMAQRGSDPKSAKGQACREQRLVFLMQDGAMFPVVVTVPRTSLASLRGYAMDLAEGQRPYFSVESVLGLTKAKSSAGQPYNKITFKSAGRLSTEETQAAKVFGTQIKAMIEEAVLDFSDAGTAEAAGEGASVGDAGPDPS